MSDIWEIYALRYAAKENRTRRESFLFADDHDAPHPIDFYVWVLKNGDQTILVDTGFDAEEGKLRNRPIIQTPAQMLTDFGLPPDSIDK
ncbi:unnamed protein product, partial [Discosporangium mesarthrocarpum]